MVDPLRCSQSNNDCKQHTCLPYSTQQVRFAAGSRCQQRVPQHDLLSKRQPLGAVKEGASASRLAFGRTMVDVTELPYQQHVSAANSSLLGETIHKADRPLHQAPHKREGVCTTLGTEKAHTQHTVLATVHSHAEVSTGSTCPRVEHVQYHATTRQMRYQIGDLKGIL